MNPITEWNERLIMALACGSPGSAWAYHRIAAEEGSGMMRRKKATADAEAIPAPQSSTSMKDAVLAWSGNALKRLAQWSYQQQVRRQEAYLAQAQNIFDLEARMRQLDDGTFARGQALR